MCAILREFIVNVRGILYRARYFGFWLPATQYTLSRPVIGMLAQE